MKIAYTATAQKQMASLHPEIAGRIREKIALYVENPRALANQVKALRSSSALRLRVGDYRVLFTADGVVLLVLRVGHRREIYD